MQVYLSFKKNNEIKNRKTRETMIFCMMNLIINIQKE
jgi:hypothetical protein